MKKESKKTPFSSKNFSKTFMNAAKKALWFLGRHAFLFILIFVVLDVMYGEWLFYQNVSLSNMKEPEALAISTQFKEKIYQDVLDQWKKRETLFGDAGTENYADPFK